ncbi:MAG: A24 family peptidase [Gammaproteobacteria bacterium]|nr:A24 family peptidase [Gammaproteobacteria bacterium]
MMAVTGLLGLLVGSFLNVVIYRVPVMMDREEADWYEQCSAQKNDAPHEESKKETFNLLKPGSACPACTAPIRAWENIPILSYLILSGKCANCGISISVRYPIIEAITGILSVVVAWKYGYSITCLGALLLCWTLIALTVIDLDRQLLPDRITLPLLWLGLLFSLITGPDGSPVFTDPKSAIIGAIAGYLSLWSIYQGFKLSTGKEGMGYGDFKLLAALGAWLGWQMLLLIIILSAGVGLVSAMGMIIFRGHDRQIPIPFGPYLAIAGFIAALWGTELLEAYLGISGMNALL